MEYVINKKLTEADFEQLYLDKRNNKLYLYLKCFAMISSVVLLLVNVVCYAMNPNYESLKLMFYGVFFALFIAYIAGKKKKHAKSYAKQSYLVYEKNYFETNFIITEDKFILKDDVSEINVPKKNIYCIWITETSVYLKRDFNNWIRLIKDDFSSDEEWGNFRKMINDNYQDVYKFKLIKNLTRKDYVFAVIFNVLLNFIYLGIIIYLLF